MVLLGYCKSWGQQTTLPRNPDVIKDTEFPEVEARSLELKYRISTQPLSHDVLPLRVCRKLGWGAEWEQLI